MIGLLKLNREVVEKANVEVGVDILETLKKLLFKRRGTGASMFS